ncbi:MAG TPA: metallophosphoesterase [Haliangiales bacterium]|nr:metallophosphoesterase [Haliangiales bacterium]
MIAFTSDLHVDHHPEVVDLVAERAAGAAALIVAGDVSARPEVVAATLERLRGSVAKVAFVPGNHDLWGKDARRRYLDELADACDRAGAEYLPAGPISVDGVTVCGQTGWYDYSFADQALGIPREAYEAGRYGPLAWGDKRYFRWPGSGDAELTAWMVERLARDLSLVPRDRPVWVVTHMLPFVELVARRPAPWGFVNGFLGAAALGEAIAAAAARGVPVARTIAGHTHFRREAVVDLGGRSVVAETSPIGYPREVKMRGTDLVAHVAERVRCVG